MYMYFDGVPLFFSVYVHILMYFCLSECVHVLLVYYSIFSGYIHLLMFCCLSACVYILFVYFGLFVYIYTLCWCIYFSVDVYIFLCTPVFLRVHTVYLSLCIYTCCFLCMYTCCYVYVYILLVYLSSTMCVHTLCWCICLPVYVCDIIYA